MKSAATPAIHGFDGSEMMTSYCRRERSRCERPSPTMRLVRGSSRARWFSAAKKARRLDHLGGDLDHVGTRNRMTQRRAERHAAAQPDDGNVARVVVHEQRQMGDELLRQHVAAIRRVRLAVNRQRRRAGEPLDRYGRRGAFPVIQERAGLEQRFQIEILRHERRIQVGAAGEEFAIPRRTERENRRRGDRGEHAGLPANLRQASPSNDNQHGANEARADDAQRPLQAEQRDEEKARGERSEDRADRVDRIDVRESTGRPIRIADDRQGERKGRTQADGSRQHERCREQAHPVAAVARRSWPCSPSAARPDGESPYPPAHSSRSR